MSEESSAKTVLVTGAGRGLGRTLATQLTARGDTVIAHARSEAALEGVPCERRLIADLTEPATVADAVAAAGIERLDALIHNAGILHAAPVAEEPLEVWRQTMAVNVIAPAELTKALLPALRAAKGHVVFINSGAGLVSAPGLSSYSASKHALKALADSLRGEEREAGVRVTSAYPSHFGTDMQQSLRDQMNSEYDPSRATSVETMAKAVIDVLNTPSDMVINELRIEPPNPLPVRPRG